MKYSALNRFFFLALVSAIIFTGCQKETGILLNPNTNLKPPVVNAGNSQVIQLPASSFTLNGFATSTNGSIKAYLWSMVSGPNVPSINSPGSKITTVTGFISGSYIFQLMATDSAGLTGVDTTSVLVNPSPVQTLTLQPNNNINEVHFGVVGSTPMTDPMAPELCAGAWTISGSLFILRGAFKFDLSSIPTTATILTAKLTLYSNPTPLNGDLINANSGPNNSMVINRVTSSWTAATMNWFTQPSVTTVDQLSIPHTNQSFLDLVDVDVKNMVATMVSGNNYGFMIRLQNEIIYNDRDFCGSRYADVSKHPKLVITYQP
jgi:hypothetical protein